MNFSQSLTFYSVSGGILFLYIAVSATFMCRDKQKTFFQNFLTKSFNLLQIAIPLLMIATFFYVFISLDNISKEYKDSSVHDFVNMFNMK